MGFPEAWWERLPREPVRENARVTRIVAGSVGGRRIEVPAKGTRPTSDKVREALFNALEAVVEVEGCRVLDLYGGSGALGLEALSRGAGAALFVESDRRAAQLLRRNVAALGFANARVRQSGVEAALLAPADEPSDVVLADPPYDLDGKRLRGVLEALVAHGWTAPGSVVVVERSARDDVPDWPLPLRGTRTRRYGETAVHWATHDPESGPGGAEPG